MPDPVQVSPPSLSPDFYLNLESGRFSGKTTTQRTDLAAAFRAYCAQTLPGVDGATRPRPLVVHFHGGLVNREKGMEAAKRLLGAYWKADGYPLFFVWEAGLVEIVQNNLREIADESIFRRLLDHVLRFVLGKAKEAVGLKGGDVELKDHDVVRDAMDRWAAEVQTGAAAAEPFDYAAAGLAAADDLSGVQEQQIVTEITTDPVIAEWVNGVESGAVGTKGAAAPVTTLMSPDVVDDIRGAPGARGFGTLRLAKGVIAIVARMIGRFRSGRDHGFHTTAIEEVLREFYVAAVGQKLWETMKNDTADAFDGPGNTHGGTAFLEELAGVVTEARAAGTPAPRVVLVGHSTGAVFICNLLKHADRVLQGVEGGTPLRFDVAFLAPACTFDLMQETLDQAKHRIGRIRVYAMHDALECRDAIAGPAYPRSLLYFVSGVVEKEADTPVMGMERYYVGRPYDSDPAVAAVRAYLDAEPGASLWSECPDSVSKKHGDFDNDMATLTSVGRFIQEG